MRLLRYPQRDPSCEQVQVSADEHKSIQLLRSQRDACEARATQLRPTCRSLVTPFDNNHHQCKTCCLGRKLSYQVVCRGSSPRHDCVCCIFSNSTTMDSRCIMSPASLNKFMAANLLLTATLAASVRRVWDFIPASAVIVLSFYSALSHSSARRCNLQYLSHL